MAPRTPVVAMVAVVAMVTLLATGCFVDQPGDTTGSTGGTTGMAATSGAVSSTTSGEPATLGATGTTTAPETTGEPTSGSTGSTDPTTATDPTTTTATTDPTMGSICPAADGFPDIDPAECRACLSASCCAQVSDCAADPACSGAWSCTQNQQCINEWDQCPGYADHRAKLDAISACGSVACGDVCTIGPCPAEQAACEQSPECQAVDDCVRTNCSNPCPADDPQCILPCWSMCQDKHPGGAMQWETLLLCLASKCP